MTDEETEVKTETVEEPRNPLLVEADAIAAKSERLIVELRKENDRREEMMARERIGGKTLGNPEVQKDETPSEYKDRIMKGEARAT